MSNFFKAIWNFIKPALKLITIDLIKGIITLLKNILAKLSRK